MNIDRKMLSEVVVMLAVCVGGWLLFVHPKITEINELEVAIATAKANPALNSRSEIEQMASSMGEAKRRIREIMDQNGLGRDSSQMYGLIMSLAKSHGVTVHHLDPGASRGFDASQPVQTTAFDMQVEGRYRQVADFLAAVEGIDGFVRPNSLSLSPKGNQENALVEARFTCEAISFQIPEVLTALVEDSDDADG